MPAASAVPPDAVPKSPSVTSFLASESLSPTANATDIPSKVAQIAVQKRTGRLRMICEGSEATYYVREKLSGAGTFKRTSNASEALRVSWDPIQSPWKLNVLVRMFEHNIIRLEDAERNRKGYICRWWPLLPWMFSGQQET